MKCDRASIGIFSSCHKTLFLVHSSHGDKRRGNSQLLRFSLFIDDAWGRPLLRGLSRSVGGGTADNSGRKVHMVWTWFRIGLDRSMVWFFRRRLSPTINAFDVDSWRSFNGDNPSLCNMEGVTGAGLEFVRAFFAAHEIEGLVWNLVLFPIPRDFGRGFSFRDGTKAGRSVIPSISSSIDGNIGKLETFEPLSLTTWSLEDDWSDIRGKA